MIFLLNNLEQGFSHNKFLLGKIYLQLEKSKNQDNFKLNFKYYIIFWEKGCEFF